jgi:hypothetical protein
MTTNPTTNLCPGVALPAGAFAADDAWAFWNNECRSIHGAERVVLNGAAEVISLTHRSSRLSASGRTGGGCWSPVSRASKSRHRGPDSGQ